MSTETDAAAGKLSRLRVSDFKLTSHSHGKAKVRVLKVRNEAPGKTISEYTVNTTLYSPMYQRVFDQEDNTDLVATDTQKNTVYVVAKRTEARSPERFGIDLCNHFIATYPMLSGVAAEVSEQAWQRIEMDGQAHCHGFTKANPEVPFANVQVDRSSKKITIDSKICGMIILKPTQSGFAGYLRDEYTLLPETDERCLSTELTCEWTYTDKVDHQKDNLDYEAIRSDVREQILKGLFGPPETGIFSASLQATIYDIGCLILTAIKSIQTVTLSTPNIHYLPMMALNTLGDSDLKFEDDVFIPTCEPSGTIKCTVSRD